MKKTVGLLLVFAVLVTFAACEKTMSGKPSEVNSANEMSQTDSSENAAAIERMAGISVGETDCVEFSYARRDFRTSFSSPDQVEALVALWKNVVPGKPCAEEACVQRIVRFDFYREETQLFSITLGYDQQASPLLLVTKNEETQVFSAEDAVISEIMTQSERLRLGNCYLPNAERTDQKPTLSFENLTSVRFVQNASTGVEVRFTDPSMIRTLTTLLQTQTFEPSSAQRQRDSVCWLEFYKTENTPSFCIGLDPDVIVWDGKCFAWSAPSALEETLCNTVNRLRLGENADPQTVPSDEDGAVHSWEDLGISFDAVRKVRYVEKGIGETGTFSDPQTVKGILEKWKTLQYTEKSEPKAEDACVFEFFKNVEDITPAFIVELLPFAVTMNGKRYGPYALESETLADDLLRQVMTER